MWGDAHPVLQLPWIDKETLKHFSSGKKSVKTIADLVGMKDVDRRSLLRALNDPQYDTLIKLAEATPVVTIESVDFKGKHTSLTLSILFSFGTRACAPREYCHLPDKIEAKNNPGICE